VQYKFEYDCEGQLPDVEKYNYKSFTAQVEEQLWKEGCSAYLNRRGHYFCKYHTGGIGVPRDGLRTGLLAHVRLSLVVLVLKIFVSRAIMLHF